MVKLKLWDILYWVFFVSCIYGFIKTADTWVRWKWGYYSIDALPYFVILFVISYIDRFMWMRELTKRISALEKKEAGK